jgi:hypothetical protein
MGDVRALFVGEGSSDRAMQSLLQELIVLAGADSASVDAPDLGLLLTRPGKRPIDQARAALELAGPVDLVLVHADADARDPEPRRSQLTTSFRGFSPTPVFVVPVQETEAWLLVDPDAIRSVCGRPRDRTDLGLPAVRHIERTASPKEVLERAVQSLQADVGRRRRVPFRSIRRMLLQQLDPEGPVNELPSFQRLRAELAAAVAALA